MQKFNKIFLGAQFKSLYYIAGEFCNYKIMVDINWQLRITKAKSLNYKKHLKMNIDSDKCIYLIKHF